MHESIILYLSLVVVIMFLVMLAQRIKIAYPIVLVLGGLVLSLIPGLPSVEIDPQLIFLIFLPPLLYEAAWQTSWKDFWKWRRVIGSFAFIIVIFTSCVIAYVSQAVIPGFTLALGFLLGGIISPPDAVATSSILQNVKVPKRLITIAEGESLLNDASSLIVFRFALVAVASGSFVLTDAIGSFFLVIGMGFAIGLGIALIFYAILRWLPTTPSIDTILTFVAPYAMYIAAEEFHFSGVIAVVTGGLFLSRNQHSILSHLSRIQGINVWSTVGFVLNGIVFMLIGLELPVIIQGLGDASLGQAIKYGLIISAVVIITRIASTVGASIFTVFISRFIKTADSSPGYRMPIIFGWAGMRGVVSLASALSIPLLLDNGQPFPQRNMILFITFVVILVTLVFQGLTLPAVARWMQAEDRDYEIPAQEQDVIIRRKLAKASLDLINEKYADEIDSHELLRGLKFKLESDLGFLDHVKEFEEAKASHAYITRYQDINKDLLAHKRQILHEFNKKETYEEEIIRQHLAQIDLEEEKVRQQFLHLE
ncbi:Na+/H+ antiporter [Dyadobacter jiangsuensis]|uniref:Sodium/proton antiporter (CPA1 family) n=1 Tax=Dyadobacter jiangsuensis TaxID=1591085 RepID=A0A2P8G8N1_9BACT|nr:Na+/H+ antiporter [Dyadobacter jiangsuensis]PSL30340.1 sodium/proton antiporter (CPA1 family) [Dyadobacter jiangsuensis]